MRIVDAVLRRPEVVANPPVLLDIGAAGGTYAPWRQIAKHCVCVAFDGDERSTDALASESRSYRQFFIHHAVATADVANSVEFFVTRSRECSSTLRPIASSLDEWAFASRFDVQDVTSVPAQTVTQALAVHGLAGVDWFKSDSQGTDLRLFRSLGAEMSLRVLAADFEPGIIDAYAGEDKLHHVLAFMDQQPFWAYAMIVRGSTRIARPILHRDMSAATRRVLPLVQPRAPGWAEVSYFNTMGAENVFGVRDHLVAWVFATIRGQHGFALGTAEIAARRFPAETIFSDLGAHSRRRLAPSALALVRGMLRRVATNVLYH